MGLRKLLREVYFAHEKMQAFGESKYELKRTARAEGQKWWVHFDKKIFSLATLKKYRTINEGFARFCLERFAIRSISDITPRMMKAYVREQMNQIKPTVMRQRMSAIAKLGEWIGQSHAFHRIASKMGQQLPKAPVSRPTYASLESVMQVIAEIERMNARRGLATRLTLESGCRLIELVRLRREDLLRIEEREGQRVGVIQLTGKGGKLRAVGINERTYRELEKAFAEGITLVNYHPYRNAVYRACKNLGRKSGGLHEFRRFSIRQFFSTGYKELRARGLTSWEASEAMRREAAERLGHVRPGITKIYLRS